MSQIYLRVLGKPELLIDDLAVESFRTWRLWGVLACLALSATPVSRATLASTFWPDVNNPRDNLKVALHHLRTLIASELLIEDGNGLALAPGVGCDAVELEKTILQGKRAKDSKKKRNVLEGAVELLRGEFLEGIAGDWTLSRRGYFFAEGYQLLNDLLALQQADGDLAAATTTSRELLRYQPDHEVASRLLLTHGDPQAIQEQVNIERLIQSRCHHWTVSRRFALRNLAVFADSFTEKQAYDICGICPADLESALQWGVVLAKEGSLSLSPIAKRKFWSKLTGSQRKRIRHQHALWFIDSIVYRIRLDSSLLAALPSRRLNTGEILPDGEVTAHAKSMTADIIAALQYCHESSAIENCHLFYLLCCDYMKDIAHDLSAYYSILTRSWESIQRGPLYYSALVHLAIMSLREPSLERFFYEFLNNFVYQNRAQEPELLSISLANALIVLHHRGDDEDFDRVLRQRMEFLRHFPEFPIPPHTHQVIAENSLARKRYPHALIHSQHFLDHWRQRDRRDAMACGLLLHGGILKGLTRSEEARLCWNEALLQYEELEKPHGQGSCLEALATLQRESGALGEAQFLIRRAIQLFEQSGDEAAVQVARGTLGDILRDRGLLEQAQALYQGGLEFWSACAHVRWTRRFEDRLRSIGVLQEVAIK
ncbi:MAG: hypothetical protein QM758_13605 [Armatimonas sp.]